MNPHLLVAVALAAISGVANGQSSGGDTATPAVPNPSARSDAFTSPAQPGDPATRLPPNVPATPSPPSTPVGVTPGGHDMSSDQSKHMDAARKACANLAGEEARQACVRQHAPTASGAMNDQSIRGGAAESSKGSDTSVSPGTGSGGGEAGRSQGGAGFPAGATPNTGNDKPSGISGKSN